MDFYLNKGFTQKRVKLHFTRVSEKKHPFFRFFSLVLVNSFNANVASAGFRVETLTIIFNISRADAISLFFINYNLLKGLNRYSVLPKNGKTFPIKLTPT